MTERMIAVASAEICAESFGDPADPAVLLIMGAMAPMTRWDADFCGQLADRGRFVIRYDHRDTGRSTCYAPGAPEYSISDLVDDAAAVLDAYDVVAADVVGMSLGGMVAQRLAIRHPERVRSLLALSTMAWATELPDDPISNDAFDAHMGALETLDWSDRTAVVDWLVGQWRLLTGATFVFDADRSRRLAELDFDRSRNIASMTNHAVMGEGVAPEETLDLIQAPILVVHGTGDPLIPLSFGRSLADAVGCELVELDGAGHDLHEDNWPLLLDLIVGRGAPAPHA